MSRLSRAWRTFWGTDRSPATASAEAAPRGILEPPSRQDILLTPVLLRDEAISRIPQPADEPFPLFNPSVCRFRNELVFCSRAANIVVANDGTMRRYAGARHMNTNYLHVFENLAEPPRVARIDDRAIRNDPAHRPDAVEDIRLFPWNGQLWGLGAAVRMEETGDYHTKQALFRIDGDRIADSHMLESPIGAQVEKNWIPLVSGGRLHIVYSVDPLVVFRFEEGKLVIHSGQLPQSNRFAIRGGTPFIPFRDRYIALVHDSWSTDTGKSYYRHRFVVLKPDLELEETSDPFFLKRRGIEYAIGMTEFHGDLLVSFGISDRRAAYAVIPAPRLDEWVVI
ncbi:MAG: hypothetical protein H6878_07865 [Rhodobiaceae bacterium]|nr:hypothetical protein [Rhodobiaceae bacterium]MCC0041223.1 hypothetical protein [Rhodobiaceae bacterium]